MASAVLMLAMLAERCGRCLDDVLRVWPGRWGCDEGCELATDGADELCGGLSGSAAAASLRDETLPRRFLTAPDLERLCLYICGSRQRNSRSGMSSMALRG